MNPGQLSLMMLHVLSLAQKSLDYREVLAAMAQCHEFKNYYEKSWLSKNYDSAILGIYLLVTLMQGYSFSRAERVEIWQRLELLFTYRGLNSIIRYTY